MILATNFKISEEPTVVEAIKKSGVIGEIRHEAFANTPNKVRLRDYYSVYVSAKQEISVLFDEIYKISVRNWIVNQSRHSDSFLVFKSRTVYFEIPGLFGLMPLDCEEANFVPYGALRSFHPATDFVDVYCGYVVWRGSNLIV